MYTLWLTNHTYPQASKSIKFKSLKKLFNLSSKKYATPKLEIEKLLKNVKAGSDIFLPLKKNTDFIFTCPSSKVWEYLELTKEELNGHLLKETFPFLETIGYKQLIKDIFTEEKKSSTINFTLYNDIGEVELNFSQTIIKYGDIVIATTNQFTEFTTEEQEEENIFFENPIQGMFIAQDDIIVRKNQTFKDMELYPSEYEDSYFNGNIITQNIGNMEWIDISSKLVNKELDSHRDQITWYHPQINQKKYYLIDAIPVTFKNTECVEYLLIDFTLRRIVDNEAIEFEENIEIAENMGKFAIVSYDKKREYNWNQEMYKILEIDDLTTKISLKKHVRKEEYDNYMEWEKQFFKKPEKNMSYTDLIHVKTAKGNEKYLYGKNTSKYNPKTKKYDNLIGILQDITETINQEKDLKNNLIKQEELIEEVHDQVKNSLQIIVSLIEIDQHIRNSKEDEKPIEDAKKRIYNLATIGESFYQEENFSNINFTNFINSELNNLEDLFNIYNITIQTEIESLEITISHAIPLGLVLDELLSNSIRNAFVGKEKGNILIKFYQNPENIILEVIDDGVGLPKGLNINTCKNRSFLMLRKLIGLIDGTMINMEPEKGTSIRICIPQETGG